MKLPTITGLRRANPGKHVFIVMVAEPDRGGGAVIVSGACDPAKVLCAGPGAFAALALDACNVVGTTPADVTHEGRLPGAAVAISFRKKRKAPHVR